MWCKSASDTFTNSSQLYLLIGMESNRYGSCDQYSCQDFTKGFVPQIITSGSTGFGHVKPTWPILCYNGNWPYRSRRLQSFTLMSQKGTDRLQISTSEPRKRFLQQVEVEVRAGKVLHCVAFCVEAVYLATYTAGKYIEM